MRYILPRLRPETARQYDFFPIPKLLLTHQAFDEIDYGAKLLYSRILSRASLSATNYQEFTDSNGNIYIIYTIEEVMDDMRCAAGTAIKMMNQLANFGLIEKKRQGQGKPTIIYVNDFSAIQSSIIQELQKVEFKNSKKWNSRTPKSGIQELQKTEFKNSKKQNSRTPENRIQELQKVESSYTNHNNTDYSENNHNKNHSILAGRNEILSDKKLLKDVELLLGEVGLPYKYKDDPIKMEAAILLLANYKKLGKYNKQPSGGYEHDSDQDAYQICVDALIYLCTMQNEITLAKQKVTAPKVIDRINNALANSGNTVELNGYIEMAINNYKVGVSSTKVKNHFAYMQAVVWQALLTGREGSNQTKAPTDYLGGKYGHLIRS